MAKRLIKPYLPPGVHRIIALGSSSWIGDVGDNKVLKYPKVFGEESERLAVEARIYQALGPHPRIIACHGLDDRGLLLEFAPMGTVESLLQAPIALRQRITWCRQAAEAVAHIHKKNVVHCDLNTRNFLLDIHCNLKLSDFQGLLVDSHGQVSNGFALENVKSYLPRRGDHSDQMSDMFALGTAFYEIMTGHEPFPDLNGLDDEGEIEKRYRAGQFPAIDHVTGGCVILKCWTLGYESCDSCVDELSAIEISTDMSLEDEHLQQVAMMSRSAATLGDQGRFDEAVLIRRDILAKETWRLGDNHMNTILAICNLAAVLKDQGRIHEAISLDRQVLEKRTMRLGDEHPDTICAMSHLATSLKDQGHLEKAMLLERQVLERSIRVCGDEHPVTISAMSNLAAILRPQGHLNEALSLERQVLEKRTRILGDEHPNTISAMSNLAATLKQQGHHGEALQIMSEVVEKMKRILGDEHPNTVKASRSLAILCNHDQHPCQTSRSALENGTSKTG